MTVALAGVAALAVAGAIGAVSAREARIALLGLVVALVAAPFVADPLPDVRVLAVRVVGAVLAAELLWPAVRGGVLTNAGSPIGWPAVAVGGLAAAAVGWSIAAGLAASPPGIELPPEVVPPGPFDLTVARAAAPAAAGLAIVALAAAPVLIPRDPVRLGIGLLLLIDGVTLLQVGLAGSAEPLEQLAIVAALVAVAAGVAALALIPAPAAEPAAQPSAVAEPSAVPDPGP
jgi:hypothetical protein